ncbi:MAG: ribonuclease P protein component [Actinobacteria bacterium]|nr:ribonuclease P protein component [Actinomycetota bacterium]MDA2951722.1 ribonuclease P protein component [Actinomycetota bacterium]MDA2998991.1 ribonuclease P protein component [Actinomycetota bacterium]
MIGRIRQRETFSRLSKEGTYVRFNGLWCVMLTDASLSQAHVGYAIGRSVGGAVLRNRIRRQLRVLVSTRESALQPGWYLIGVQPQVARLTFMQLGETVDGLFAKVATA